ncbi:hypothetical protein BH09VER1_BH09VER1_34340 [soil metagenome]
MTHLDRAKSWIQKSTRNAALAVLPIAAASVAHATLSFSGTSFFDASGGVPDPSGQTTQLSEYNGIAGANYSLTAPFTYNATELDYQIYTTAITDQDLAAGTVIPLAWSIDVDGASEINWGQVSFSLYSSSVGSLGFFFASLPTPGPFVGSQDLTTTQSVTAGTVIDVTIGIYAGVSGSGPITFHTASATVNPVPEPDTTALLLVAGLGVWIVLRRRRCAT